MLFNSMAFAIFLPIVFALYWLLPHRFRWVLLLVSSYYFYMSWDARYLLLILFTTLVSYVAARRIETAVTKKKKKICVAAALTVSLGVLFFFKYYNFFATSLTETLQKYAIEVHPKTLAVIVPVGISFYTFQTLSYVIDVYRGDIKAEHHFGKYAAFISFFPQLVAGPIERSKNLLPQIREERKFDYDQASYGVLLMVWGFFKKLVVADNLAIHVDAIYGNINNYTGLPLVAAVLFFALQIYCDFSGYSDIAIGTAKLFGINLMANFKSPYFSASIKEFWSRWHISLSTWFRDYVYIPMGGSRVGKIRHAWNLLVTFLASGLWHGAAWTYVYWGGVHGAAQILESNLLPGKGKIKEDVKHTPFWWIRVLLVFLFCCAAWVLFRAENMGTVIYIFQNMWKGIGEFDLYWKNGVLQLGMSDVEPYLLGGVIFLLAVYDYLSLRRDVILSLKKLPAVLRYSVYVLVLLIVIVLSPTDSSKEFIYFQF